MAVLLTVCSLCLTLGALVRSQVLVGQESCMQIFSVPKTSIMCEPSAEVRASLEALKESTEVLREDLGGLTGRLDDLDPNIEKELPEEVKQRLEQIEELKISHATQVEAMKHVDEALQTTRERLTNLEESNREEIAKVLEQQVQLIQMTWDKSNVTLHKEYVDQLTTYTQDLVQRLQQLELDLKDQLHGKDGEWRTRLEKVREDSLSEVADLGLKVEGDISSLAEKLESELEKRLFYFNMSDSHNGALEMLRTMLTSVRENQAKAMEDRQKMNVQVTSLSSQMSSVSESSSEGLDRASKLQTALELLEGRVGEMSGALEQCENRTGDLKDKLATLKELVDRREHMLPRTLKIHDCQDVLQFYFPVSGVYQVNLNPSTLPYDVFCQLEETVGWTVIQRRQDGELDFFKGWADYKDGFGDPRTEYWLGLQHLHTMTSQKNYSLRVDLEEWNGKWRHAFYESFRIDGEDKDYTLHVSGYSGDAGDALAYHDGKKFSTMDKNNDNNDGICAAMCHGAWWYDDCYHSNLNGRYYQDGNYLTSTGWGDGVVWRTVTQSNYYSMKTATMKIKPRDVGTS